jgi:chromosome segregation ATPase
MLNRDGSRRAVVPPTLTVEEQARQNVLLQQQEQQRAEREEARRRDRALLMRYPDRATYEAARARALAPVQQYIEVTLNRLTQLEAENARLRGASDQSPEALRQRKLMNDGAIEAQRNMLRSHLEEQARLQQQMDVERERLEVLWGHLASVTGSAPSSGSEGADRGNSR